MYTTNTLFETSLQVGDLFVFPKDMLHFQRNNQNYPASDYSIAPSENPGILPVAVALFASSGTGLPNKVLETALCSNGAQPWTTSKSFSEILLLG